MTPSAPCPDPSALGRLLLGLLPEEEAERLEEHLLQCPSCVQVVQAVRTEDRLVALLRTQSGMPLCPEKEVVERLVQGLLERVTAIHNPAARRAAPEAQTFCPPSAETAEDLFDFLGPPNRPGELGRLGTYRVLKVLGVGGMGVVFLAEDPQLQRQVALKTMKRALAANAQDRQRFLREAQAAAALDHDHIITIYQVGEDRGVPFLAMQLLHGETLEDRVKREGRLSAAEVLRIGREISTGLAAAHERGLIHRDVKPANIWLESRMASKAACPTGGRVKILDFGLARAVGGDPPAPHNEAAAGPAGEGPLLTDAGMLMGTPAYMAPEQALGSPVDARCDLFSLGCVLYRLCTGAAPFQGSDKTDVLRALTRDDPQPPGQLNRAVPPALSGLILKLLAKRPEDRYPSAQSVAEALAAIEKTPPVRRWPRRGLLAAVVLGLLATAAVVPLIWKRRGAEHNDAGMEMAHFALPVRYAVGKQPYAVAIADVNGDGAPDLVVSNINSNTVSVLLSNGDGTFRKAVHYAVGAGPHGLAVADFDGDGLLDLAVACRRDNAVNVLRGKGDGTFRSPVAFATGVGPRGLFAGDFNGDRKLDLVTSNEGGHTVSVLLGDGAGSFRASGEYAVGKFPVYVTAVDLDGDGQLDLAVANGGSDTLSVLRGRGDGTFHKALDHATGSGPGMIGVADFNGDGWLDLATENYGSNDVSVLLGNGAGTFRRAVAYGVGAGPGGLVVGDFNGDGRPDLAAANHNSNNVTILLGLGNGSFRPGGTLVTRVTPAGIAAADLNGDGRLDLAVVNHRSHDLSVLLSRAPSPLFRVTAPFTAPLWAPSLVTVTALDARHHSNRDYTGTIRLTSSDPLAVLPGMHTFGPGESGTYSFNVVFKTPGPQTITVTDTARGAMCGQALVVVNRATAAQFRIEAPGRVKVGTAFTVYVRVLDALGHGVTDYAGTVRLTCTDTRADLPGEYRFAAGDQGGHSFRVTLRTPGVATLTASDTRDSNVRGSVRVLVQAPAAEGGEDN